MASLLELSTIEDNSVREPGGDPGATPPVPPNPDILAARNFRSKIKMAVLKHAADILETSLPTDDTRGPALERLAWAQQAVAAPEQATQTLLRLALAQAPDNATPAQIVGYGDGALMNGIAGMIPLLATGMHPGR